MVEESQDTMSKEEYEALMRNENNDETVQGKQQTENEGAALTKQLPEQEIAPKEKDVGSVKEQEAAIGVSRKKRTIVAVGVEDKDDDQQGNDSKPKKVRKSKKVKLSFDDAS